MTLEAAVDKYWDGFTTGKWLHTFGVGLAMKELAANTGPSTALLTRPPSFHFRCAANRPK